MDTGDTGGRAGSDALRALLGTSNAGVVDDTLLNLFMTLPAAVYACDAEGRLTFYNKAAAELWGREPARGTEHWTGAWRTLGVDGKPLLPREDILWRTVAGEHQGAFGELVVERPDGTRRTVHAHTTALRDGSGARIGALAMMLDITESHATDVARSRLAAIVESSDDAIVSKDLDGIVTSWNRGAERLFGYTAAEMIGRSITQLIPHDRLDEEAVVLGRIRRGESVEHYETVRRRRDGSFVDVSLTISPIVDPRGRVIGASKIAHDITDRKRSELALRQTDRRKDEFIATLAHELRNPLAPLKNSIDYLRLGAHETPPAEVVDMMERQLNHLVHLVDDLLEVSRITRGSIPLKKEVLEIKGPLQAALEMSQPQIEAGEHRLELALTSEPLMVTGDRTRLAQIVSNLLNNAAKFTPKRGLIRVMLERQGGHAVLRVADNGIGIPREMLSSVFDLFVQVRPKRERADSGLGIGLSLVRRLVELHGGSVEARSAGPDQGSEFIVRLPLRLELPETAGAPRPPEPASAAQRRVLVVDDNRDAADSLALLLRALGHHVQVAHSGAEGIDVAATLRPDVILLDIGMPGMSGYEVASMLRGEPWGRNLTIIALTGWGQDIDRARTAQSGFDHHLVKPVPYATLQKLLASPAPRQVH